MTYPAETSRLSAVHVDQTAMRRLQEQIQSQAEEIIRAGIEDCGVRDEAEAIEGLRAFAQWFLVAASNRDANLVMLRGTVDRMWHASILNTQFYADLCKQHASFFVHHAARPGVPPHSSVVETVTMLYTAYGNDLSPLLAAWSPTTIRRLAPSKSIPAERNEELPALTDA